MRTNLLQANSLRIPLRDKVAQCVITSPPYYGLRDYGIEGQLGLESTLQEYIENTVMWCREVHRVLRDDGAFWLNMGDSYAGNNSRASFGGRAGYGTPREGVFDRGDLPEKNLMGVPWRVALALQEDGWYLRSDIIWHKPNPMPESVRDRPTKSHEYIFLLTKNKRYYYDQDAIREKANYDGRHDTLMKGSDKYDAPAVPGQSAHTFALRGHERWPDKTEDGSPGRNKRTVWTMNTTPYPGTHFATFPPELPEICIKAGTSEKGACPVCGAGWVRETDVSYKENTRTGGSNNRWKIGSDKGIQDIKMKKMDKIVKTLGWSPSCNHNEEPIPAIVLDPFVGSGTTVMVANALGRKGIGIDLSWDYLQLAKERTGMKAMEEWEKGKQVEATWEETPLFRNLQDS